MKPRIRKPFEGKFPISFKFGECPSWYSRITGYPHNGVDFALPVGNPVIVCDKGRVVWADNACDGRGLSVHVLHDWGLSVYYHLSSIYARFGNEVKRGDVLGLSGVSGWATGPHLHFGIKVKGHGVPGMRGWCNPLKYLGEPIDELFPPPIVPRHYIVRPGDSLWKIALKFYQKGIFWRKIYDANRMKIKDPRLIHPFQRLLIP